MIIIVLFIDYSLREEVKNMPRFNGTGPTGQGARTGRGMGRCGGGLQQGLGYGRGYGLGQRRFISSANNLTTLEDEEQILEKELAAVKAEKDALKNQQK
jgi:hypothetical protein